MQVDHLVSRSAAATATIKTLSFYSACLGSGEIVSMREKHKRDGAEREEVKTTAAGHGVEKKSKCTMEEKDLGRGAREVANVTPWKRKFYI